tara:strand:+ start:712 stop:1419 length:708 start_codon:yes stop_codon:yes gene_type:complete
MRWSVLFFLGLVSLNSLGLDDYSHFYGRVTDVSDDGRILRVNTENKNIKLFRAGDVVNFRLTKNVDGDDCIGYVRDIDGDYLVYSVTSYAACSIQGERLRVGTLIKLESKQLFERINDALVFRDVLQKRKDDFLLQLNEVNQWLWSFREQKLKEVAKFDQEIEEIKLKKFKAVSNLNIKRKDYLHLQRELKFRLDELDRDIEFYRIQNSRVLRDRWAKDRDLGIQTLQPHKKVIE